MPVKWLREKSARMAGVLSSRQRPEAIEMGRKNVPAEK
jgi:hypothetical protein